MRENNNVKNATKTFDKPIKASFFFTFDDTQKSPTLFSRKYKYKCILRFIENENRLNKPIKLFAYCIVTHPFLYIVCEAKHLAILRSEIC